MVFSSRILVCGLTVIAFLTFGGCSPSTAVKPEPSSSAGASADKGKAGTTGPAGKSSLEALRAGEAPVTPASSPLKEIYFEFDRYDLRPDARAVLKANADWLKRNPSVRVQIEGHCDERGTTEYNLALGGKRAQVAKDFLVSLGIPTDRLSTISYGKEVQVCREHDDDCWQRNRRDRFVVAARPQS